VKQPLPQAVGRADVGIPRPRKRTGDQSSVDLRLPMPDHGSVRTCNELCGKGAVGQLVTCRAWSEHSGRQAVLKSVALRVDDRASGESRPQGASVRKEDAGSLFGVASESFRGTPARVHGLWRARGSRERRSWAGPGEPHPRDAASVRGHERGTGLRLCRARGARRGDLRLRGNIWTTVRDLCLSGSDPKL
jgi:hypothetical protein